MKPILFTIFGNAVPAYTVFSVLAMFAAMWVVRLEAKRYGWDVRSASWLVVHCTVVGFLASHVLYAFTRFDLPWNEWWWVLVSVGYGNVWYGGFIASWGLCFLYARKKHLDIWKIFDMGSLSILPAQAVGRIGCLFNGCCYGKPTNAFWGVYLDTYEYGFSKVHPTSTYESVYLLFVFLILWKRRKLNSFSGQTAVFYCLLTPIGRFLIEFFRGDTVRGFVIGGLSTSQFIALLVFLTGLILWKYRVRSLTRT